jgi:hypothetical protein
MKHFFISWANELVYGGICKVFYLRTGLRIFSEAWQGDQMSLLINGQKCCPAHFLSKINAHRAVVEKIAQNEI